MTECDFYDCNLKESIMDNCDIKGVIFESTNLFKADLRNSYNLLIDIRNNNINKAKFNNSQASGLLAAWEVELS